MSAWQINTAVDVVPAFITPPHLSTPSRLVGEKQLGRVIREMQINELSHVVDIGCGNGEYRFLFPKSIYTGIDIVDRRFRQKTSQMHRFLISNATCLPLKSNSCDLVFSSYAFEYFSDPELVLAEIHRILKPEGKAVICLPAKWILIYELFPKLLRHLGINPGKVSAQDGIKHYSPIQLSKLAKRANLTTMQIVSIYGWAILVLKTISIWYRILLHLITKALSRIFKTRNTRMAVAPLYVPRKVLHAKNYEEWQEIIHHELTTRSYIKRVYVALVEFANYLDSLTGFKPIAEYIAVFSKPKDKTYSSSV